MEILVFRQAYTHVTVDVCVDVFPLLFKNWDPSQIDSWDIEYLRRY